MAVMYIYLRDLEFEKSDWFYMGIADITLSAHDTSGPADDLQGGDASGLVLAGDEGLGNDRAQRLAQTGQRAH